MCKVQLCSSSPSRYGEEPTLRAFLPEARFDGLLAQPPILPATFQLLQAITGLVPSSLATPVYDAWQLISLCKKWYSSRLSRPFILGQGEAREARYSSRSEKYASCLSLPFGYHGQVGIPSAKFSPRHCSLIKRPPCPFSRVRVVSLLLP